MQNAQQIERKAERMMDELDKAFLGGAYDQEEYDFAVRDIENWTRDQYKDCQEQRKRREQQSAYRR